jgi:hypothetical protein
MKNSKPVMKNGPSKTGNVSGKGRSVNPPKAKPKGK